MFCATLVFSDTLFDLYTHVKMYHALFDSFSWQICKKKPDPKTTKETDSLNNQRFFSLSLLIMPVFDSEQLIGFFLFFFAELSHLSPRAWPHLEYSIFIKPAYHKNM